MSRFKNRNDAIWQLVLANGRYLREMDDRQEQYTWLTKNIDLAWLPKALADRYEKSDRAWRRFLNDIIDEAGAW